MSRIFFDFEFIEDGSAFVMEPISLGMIREEPYSELYIEFDDVMWSKANDWVIENVQKHLKGYPYITDKESAKNSILDFVGEEPEFWAYFADYDWVLLCQLFGRMVDLPKGWPYYCLDIKQYMYHLGLSRDDMPNQEGQEHHALEDAKWNLQAWKLCDRTYRVQ